MLLVLKEDNTTGTLYLCHLLCVIRMIIKSGALCTNVHLYTIIICTNGMTVYMYPFILLATGIYVC